MKLKGLPMFAAILMIAMLACQTLTPSAPAVGPTATTLPPTATNTDVPTITSTPTITPTKTLIPDPGIEMLKKINPNILKNGAVAFFGDEFDRNDYQGNGNTLYTQGYNALVLIKHNGHMTMWFGETYMAYTIPEGATYITYLYNSTSDVNVSEAVSQLLYVTEANARDLKQIMPFGFKIVFSRQGFESDGVNAASDDIVVTVDHQHIAPLPDNTIFPARDYTELNKDDVIEFAGGAIRSFVCKGSEYRTVVVAFDGYQAVCDEIDAEMMNVHFGTLKSPREGTPKENERLLKYLLTKADEFGGVKTEYFWHQETQLGDFLPISRFQSTHLITEPTRMPTATATVPSARPTPNITTVEVTCTDSGVGYQSVTYTVTGPMTDEVTCAANLTKQDVPVQTLQIPASYGTIYITLDRVGGVGGMYAVVIYNVPDAYGTPTFTLTGTSMATGHPTKTVTDDVLRAVLDSETVFMTYTVDEFTVAAEAEL